MNIIKRNHDVIDNGGLEKLHTFLNFPCFMGCVDHDKILDVMLDMNFYIGETSGCIQINPIPPLEVIYQNSHGSGTIGSLWNLHHEAFADFIKEYNPTSIIEIGGGTGILSKKYKNKNASWTIIEPNPDPVEDCTAEFIKSFFDENLKLNKEFDAVVHSHVLEHVFYPDVFLSNISKLMTDGKLMFFSVPNLQESFKRYYTNALNFEHTILLTEPYIEFLLAKNKFKILSKKYFRDDHSTFYVVMKSDNIVLSELQYDLYQTNKKLFFSYVEYYDDLIKQFNSKMAEKKTEIYLFGAHVFSQFLINRGLDTTFIKSIIDNDTKKQGKRLYGTNLYVESPKVLIGKSEPWVILKVSNYANEIKNDILENINRTTKFLE